MTTTDPAPLKSHEAARGSRQRRLNEIDLLYQGIREDIEAERDLSWAAAIRESCARISEFTEGLVADMEGTLRGNPLKVQIASKRVVAELDLMRQEWSGLQFRTAMALDAAEEQRLAARSSFDFDMTPPQTDAEVIEEILADLASTAPDEADALIDSTQTQGA